MELKDLHIMQQIQLIHLYTENFFAKLFGEITEDSHVYKDEINNVVVPIDSLKAHMSTFWYIPEKELMESKLKCNRLSVFYDLSRRKGLDSIEMHVAWVENEKFIPLGKFGLHSNYIIKGVAEDEYRKIRTMLLPFKETEDSVAHVIDLLDRYLAAVEKVKLLPSRVFELIAIDVPLLTILNNINYATSYSLNDVDTKPKRRTTTIEILRFGVYRLYYEKPNKPSIVFNIGGDKYNVIIVEMLPAVGNVEKCQFEAVIEKDITTFTNSIVDTIETIISDSADYDVYKPLLRKFLKHFNSGVKHVKNSFVLHHKE